MATKTVKQIDDSPIVFDLSLPDTTLTGMVTRRVAEANAHWEKEYDLKKVRDRNAKLANSKYVKEILRDERYEEIYSDNKLFTSIRTVLPFLTAQMTQPEITPANSDSLSLQFAKDYEKILVEEADNVYGRDKVKLALQDLFEGQRVGVLKWVYNAAKGKLELIHCKPDSIVIGCRSMLHDEPDFVQHTQKRTVGDLIRQFPDKKDDIYGLYEITKGVPSQLEVEKDITENWIFVEEEDGLKLAIIWMAGDSLLLGKMSDPNWMDGKDNNVIDEHMMPFVFFNFLNDGSGYIDNNSFVEMAQYSQKQYDKRGSTIAENAAYAGTGVPVFGKDAVKEETASKIRFSPVQRILLDSDDVSKSFTTWNGGTLPAYIVEDQANLKQSILDTFGTNQIQQGATPENPNDNLGQDILLRDQAQGRQQELIDCVDNGMSRFFQILAQMIYRYFDDEHYYNFIGDDGAFEHLVISQTKIAKNTGIKIKIKSGSSLPVDRSQRLAAMYELAKLNRIGTLRLYKEIGIDSPEEAYKEFLQEHLLPFGDLSKMDSDIVSREAEEDLQMVIGGKMPNDREDMDDDYINYLNEYLLTNKYEMLPQATQIRVTKFIATIIALAKRKALKLSTQQPIIPAQTGQLPPIRAKISMNASDLEPDVKAQIVQNAGYKPSQLVPAELQAGLVDSPTIRETLNGNPLTDPAANNGLLDPKTGAAPPPQQPSPQQMAAQQLAAQPQPVVIPPKKKQ